MRRCCWCRNKNEAELVAEPLPGGGFSQIWVRCIDERACRDRDFAANLARVLDAREMRAASEVAS